MVHVQSLSFDTEEHLTWEPADVSTLLPGWLHALSPGQTSVTIAGTVDGFRARGRLTLETRVAARARYSLHYLMSDDPQDVLSNNPCAPGEPLLARPGTVLRGIFQVLLDSEERVLAGDGLLPLLVGGGQVESDPLMGSYRGHQPLAITLPSEEGTVTLVPPVGTQGLTIEVSEATAITGIASAATMHGWGEVSITLWTELDSAADCFWTGVPMVGTVETPSECIFIGGDQTSMTVQGFEDPIRLWPLSGAPTRQCTIRFVTQLGAPEGEHETVLTFSTEP